MAPSATDEPRERAGHRSIPGQPAFDVPFDSLVADSNAMTVRSTLVLPAPDHPLPPEAGPVVIDVPSSASNLVVGLGSYGS
jgi:hypothetical protein